MKDKIIGFDYLRPLFAIFVVAWHSLLFGKSIIFSISNRYIPNVIDIIYVNLLNLAVPVFMLMSLFLYIKNRNEKGEKYFFKSIKNRLITIVFWITFYFIIGRGVLWQGELGAARNIYMLIFSGFGTLFYFMIHLVILTILAEILRRYPSLFILKLMMIISLLIIIISYFLPQVLRVEALRFYSPVNFLPYLFIAFLIYSFIKKNYSRAKIKLILIILISLGILSALIEWILLPNKIYVELGYAIAIPIYGRNSQIIFATFIVLSAYYINKPAPKSVKILSEYSLSIYCLHPLVITFISNLKLFNTCHSILSSFLNFILILLITIGLSVVLSKYKNILFS